MRTKRSIPMALMWLWCVVLLFECVCAYHVYIGNTHLFRYMFAWLSLFPPIEHGHSLQRSQASGSYCEFCMCSCVNARNRFLHFNWNTNTRLNAINTSHIVNVLLNPTGIFSVNYVLFVKTKTQTNTCRLSFGRRLLCRYFGFFVFATIDFISFIFSIFAARHWHLYNLFF